jgi:hypothetical protein
VYFSSLVGMCVLVLASTTYLLPHFQELSKRECVMEEKLIFLHLGLDLGLDLDLGVDLES